MCRWPLGKLACVAGGIVWVRDQSFGGGAVFQKKGVFAARDGSAIKSHSTTTQYCQLRRLSEPLLHLSKIQLVVYFQCCILIG